MKKTQFTVNQIISMLKQHEQGIKVQDIARANGISEKTIYRWKTKYGDMANIILKENHILQEILLLEQARFQ